MAEQFDLIVIGSGVAGAAAAYRCRGAGWRVAVIDQLPFGGTCALRGCDPKKVLAGVAETLDQEHRLRGKGIGGPAPAINWRDLMAFKRGFTDPVPAQREKQLADKGIAAFHGRARFRSHQSIEVNGATLEARFILIATGAAPMRMNIPGEEYLATSTDFLELDDPPRRLVLVGGGFIAAEFSHIAALAGAHVTVLEREDRLLRQFDPDLVALLAAKTRDLGVDLRLGARVEAIARTKAGLSVTAVAGRTTANIEADLAVHAAGRVPDLSGLELDAGGVETEKGRLKLNDYLQSVSNPAVYAAGDAASLGPPLTPVAAYDGNLAAANMLNGNRARPDYAAVPSVVFTSPPLARVGLLEEEARARKLKFRVRRKNTASWYTSRRVAEECAGFKVLIEEGSEKILGAHLIGPNAEEVINIFAVAMRAAVPAGDLRRTMFAYPTAGSDISYML